MDTERQSQTERLVLTTMQNGDWVMDKFNDDVINYKLFSKDGIVLYTVEIKFWEFLNLIARTITNFVIFQRQGSSNVKILGALGLHSALFQF